MEPDKFSLLVGQKIKKIRKSEDITQGQLADQIGISRASLANIEAGRQHVLTHRLYCIAQVLNLDSLDKLLPPIEKFTPSKSSVSSFRLHKDEDLTEEQKQAIFKIIRDA